MGNRLAAFVILAVVSFPALAQQKTNSLNFQVTDFKVEAERFAVKGRGLVKLAKPDLKEKIIAVRLHYVLRLKKDAFTYSGTTGASITNGVGLVELFAAVPEAVATAIREQDDYVILKWELEGWYFMNPGTVSD